MKAKRKALKSKKAKKRAVRQPKALTGPPPPGVPEAPPGV
mgnify:CR=1 FL=1